MNSKNVGILDYGAGNFGSVRRALQALSVEPVPVARPADVQSVDQLIFPGVGSAGQAMSELRARGLDEAIVRFAQSGRPLLGICVGMQVLGKFSAEGGAQCLGLLPYRIDQFTCSDPVPHMGWNSLQWNDSHPRADFAKENLAPQANLYFVHSYAAFLDEQNSSANFLLASCEYGRQTFAALVAHDNIWGAQCHVEKSGRAGLEFIKNFLRQR